MKKKIFSAHGFDFRSRKIKKLKNASRTPGKQKTDACQATTLDRLFAKRSRAYKHPQYNRWANTRKEGNVRVPIR